MLMDEPFGAVDPIAREKLQNEFLRLQEEIGKTIVFVTHDIDEAIKMGDRIAVLRDQSVIAQYDTPERILSDPADEFVAEFIGSGASLKRLGLARVRDFTLADMPVSPLADGRDAAAAVLAREGGASVLLLDAQRRPVRWASPVDLRKATGSLDRVGLAVNGVVQPQATLAGAARCDGVQPRRCRRRRRQQGRLPRHRRHGRDHGCRRNHARRSSGARRRHPGRRRPARPASGRGRPGRRGRPVRGRPPHRRAVVTIGTLETEGVSDDVVLDPTSVTPGPAKPSLWRYIGLPIALALVLGATLYYVSTAELDDIEARLLDPDKLISATLRHLRLVAESTVIVVLLAVPLGILATRPSLRRLVPLIVGLGNIAQGVPSLGVVVLFAVVLTQIGVTPAIFALVLYAFLPILRNTIVGLEQVDPFVIESARGMGLSRLAVLRRIELPLAVPVMLAGIRTAAVINVGTATIAALIDAGGLGEIIYQGLVLNRQIAIVVGSILAAVLALLLDYIGGLLEQALRPKGL